MPKQTNRVYFPNLNSIRFFAALAVVIHHIELTKHWFGLPNIYTTSFVGGVFGQLGIILFFVLSGFLITYLLLEENRQTGTISIKDFYIRRILRIWPLYYLITILGLYILPKIDFFFVPGFTEHVGEHLVPKSAMFLTFFSDIAYALYKHVPYAAQTWSVGVEEQFYLLWPVLVVLVLRKKRMKEMLVGVIGFYLLIKLLAVYLYSHEPANKAAETFFLFWNNFTIDAMAIGGIGAYLLFYQKEKVLSVLFSKYLQIILYLVLIIITGKGWALPWFSYEVYAVLFVVLILNLAGNPRSVINLEYKPLNYLGKISYGLYMYHNIMLVVALKLLAGFQWFDLHTLWGNVIYYIVSIGFTITISSLSYEYFEKWFIKAKVRFSKVISGENAVEKGDKQPSGSAVTEKLPYEVVPNA